MKKASQEIWWRDAQNVSDKQGCASVASVEEMEEPVSSGFVDAMSAIIDTIYAFILLIDQHLRDLLNNQRRSVGYTELTKAHTM